MMLRIVGDSPLICQRWVEQERRDMLCRRYPVDPLRAIPGTFAALSPFKQFTERLYWISPKPEEPTPEDVAVGIFGFPILAFKNAAAQAVRAVSRSMTKAEARQAIQVFLADGGSLAELESSAGPHQRQHEVIFQGRTIDTRHQAEFPDWATTLMVAYSDCLLSREQVLGMFDAAGFGVGVGEWRPELGGAFGRFRVEQV